MVQDLVSLYKQDGALSREDEGQHVRAKGRAVHVRGCRHLGQNRMEYEPWRLLSQPTGRVVGQYSR